MKIKKLTKLLYTKQYINYKFEKQLEAGMTCNPLGSQQFQQNTSMIDSRATEIGTSELNFIIYRR